MKNLVVLAALIAGFLFLARLTIPKGPYGYDEADYMFDAGLGLTANYTDRGALPITDFIREGLTRGRIPSQRHALSEMTRSSNDVTFYRHWHGPMYYYWLVLASQFAHDENSVRWLSLIFPILACSVIFLGCLWISRGREGALQAILSSALFIWSGITVGSLELAPHQFFVFWFLLGLFCLAKMITAEDRRYFYPAAVVAGFAFSTLEVTFVLVAVMLACLVLERHWLRPDWGFAWRSVALFLGTILLAWPGAILKLSFLKSYLGIAYLAVFRKAPWGNIGLAETWAKRLLASPIEWVLILLAIGMFLASRGWTGHQRYLYPFLLFGVLMMLTTAKVAADAPRYALPFMPVFEVVAGCTVAGWLAKKSPAIGYGGVAALCAAVFVTSWVKLSSHPYIEDPRNRALLRYVEDNRLGTSTVLVPVSNLPTLHYYFPQMGLRSFEGTGPVPDDFAGKTFDGVLYPTDPIRFDRK